MTEIDLIVKYLERRSSKVIDYSYYNEGLDTMVDSDLNIGSTEGVDVLDNFFFGHVTLRAAITGVVVLTNDNLIGLSFHTSLKGRIESGISVHNMGVNLGMSLMGNGEYEGNKRIYGMGFNKVVVAGSGLGAATWVVQINCNGYLFKMK